MAEQDGMQVFISYSRKDSLSVEKLAATLVGMGYNPWVDRSRIEGGMEFEKIIRSAIEASIAFVLVLTPESAQSEWVNFEFLRARNLKKPIFPLLYKPVNVSVLPVNWGEIQHIDMQVSYDEGIKQLGSRLRHVMAVSPKPVESQPSAQPPKENAGRRIFGKSEPPPKAEPRLSADEVTDIYRRAVRAIENGDLENAARLLQELVDDDQQALRGIVQAKLLEIQPALKGYRINRLLQAITQARAEGDWRQEYALFDTLSSLRKLSDAESHRMEQARNNREYQNNYNVIIGLVEDGSNATAITDLRDLWKKTNHYGDPAGLAHKLHILTEEEEEQKLADERAAIKKQEDDAAAEIARQAALQRQADELRNKINVVRSKSDTAVYTATEAVTGVNQAVGIITSAVNDVSRLTSTLTALRVTRAIKSLKAAKVIEAQDAARQVSASQVVAETAVGKVTTAKNDATQAASRAKTVQMLELIEVAASEAASAAQVAQSVDYEAKRAAVDAEKIARQLAHSLKELEFAQEMRDPKGFVRHVFGNGRLLDMWLAIAYALIGAGTITAILTHSQIDALSVVGGFMVLGYILGYRRVVYWPFILIAALIAAGAAMLIIGQSAQLVAPQFQSFTFFGLGPFHITGGYAGELIFSYGAIWATICGILGLPIGFIAGLQEGEAGTALVGSIGGAILGAVIGFVIGMLLVVAVVILGWLFAGIAFGALVGLIAGSSAISAEWHFSGAMGVTIGILMILALIPGVLFTKALGQPLTDTLLWSLGLAIGGIAGVGLVTFVVIVANANRQHRFVG